MADKNINIAHAELEHLVKALKEYDERQRARLFEPGKVITQETQIEVAEARRSVERILRRLCKFQAS